MDMSAISAILGSIKTASDLAKLIKDSGISLQEAEGKMKLADLISALADAKIEMASVQQVLIEKDSEIHKLQEKLEIKKKLYWARPYYWLIDGDKKDGPYCQQCYDKNKELIRLQDLGTGSWRCSNCKEFFTDNTYRTQSRADNEWDPFDR